MNNISVHNSASTTVSTAKIQSDFLDEVIRGLSASPKFLSSKYFYDELGDNLFQYIMNCEEYYPYRCELEIFQQHAPEIVAQITKSSAAIDLIELGPGDCSKSIYLLKQLTQDQVKFTYLPIDISTNVITFIEKNLPQAIPGINVQGLNGDYFDMLEKLSAHSGNKKVILFMGSNLGNMSPVDAIDFCRRLRRILAPGDQLILGMDLKKEPKEILAAYNDKGGLTKAFNLNLLKRINRELGADFQIGSFTHFPSYDPITGACRSYLISMDDQIVNIEGLEIGFKKHEAIYMEISQKYNAGEIDELAEISGFIPERKFHDSRSWFTDAIWVAV
ncbi:L-histidine N(alpha)-methyltransferase [Pedobacter miscanthi]|uniref:L-histidine N(Alpha)-methyltransferase n=1 Tax=Pedobacter miscanthi TaxID=2259170 RepID=A0A366KYV3_9SPHI|nr:L-histidine N(alpha)-methyltransferase [Pedobacter miscanthi]RBQ06768.1 L-histidine N(alpha)-methyltransferase [Pedobacter miscanthi]